MLLVRSIVIMCFLVTISICVKIEETNLALQCIKETKPEENFFFQEIAKKEPFMQGGFGKLYSIAIPESSVVYAIKVIEVSNLVHVYSLSNEIAVLKLNENSFDSIGISEERGCFYIGNTFYLIMPKMSADLTSILTKNKQEYNVKKETMFERHMLQIIL